VQYGLKTFKTILYWYKKKQYVYTGDVQHQHYKNNNNSNDGNDDDDDDEYKNMRFILDGL